MQVTISGRLRKDDFMVKKNKREEQQEEFEQTLVTELLPYAMERYAGAVILDRAIPDVRDGLKPVHRRLLYTMHKFHFGSKNKHTKLAKVSGLVLGYHPHNSMAISDAAVLLSQNWVQNMPLVEIEGNNGSIDGDMHAADRYIEARLTPEAEYLLNGLDQNSVDFQPTYDNEDTEPVILPAEWPVLFTNGAMGIAVGFASNIPPHNPIELLKGAELLNREPDTTLPQLMSVVKGPDFPTGGIIMGKEDVVSAYETGKGSFAVRGRVVLEDGNIIITELPYDVRKKDLVEDMVKAIERDDLLPFVKDIVDESKGHGVRVVIVLEKGADAQMILNVLYKKSKLQQNFAYNAVAIHDGKPVTLGLLDYLKIFLDFKKEVTRRRYAYEWSQSVGRLEIVKGFIRLYDIAEDVVAVIKQSNDKADAVSMLESHFEFTPKQATSIAEMPLYRVSNQDVIGLRDEKKTLNARLKVLQDLATDELLFTHEISAQLNAMTHAFADHDRHTELRQTVDEIVIEPLKLIQEKDVMVVVKSYGAQRMTETAYENNHENYDGDVVVALPAQTTDKIVFFTEGGQLIQRLVADLETSSINQDPNDWRKEIKAFSDNDRIIGASVYDDDKLSELVVMSFTRYGQAKKHLLENSLLSFNNKGYLTRSKVYNGLKLDNDTVVRVDVDTNDAFDAVQYAVQRESGGRLVTIAPSDQHMQGVAGSGTNRLAVTDPTDAMVIIDVTDK